MTHSTGEPLNGDATQRFPVPNHQVAEASTEHFRAATPPPVVLRRARPSLFIPPEPSKEEQMVSRNMLTNRRIDKPELSRNRRIAGDLPSWDPTPPGEIRVMPRRTPDVT